MRDRGLIIAWAVLFLTLAGAALFAQLAYDGRQPKGAAEAGARAGGNAISIDRNATGAASGTALTGPNAVGGGPAGRATGSAPAPSSQQADALTEAAPPPRVAFAAEAPPDDGRPRIVLIMTDIGLSRARSREAVERLPPGVTLAVLSYAEDREQWILDARAAGHEVLLAAPMEPTGYPNVDPGPNPLLIDMDDLENLARYDRALRDSAGVVGVMPNHGDRFLADRERIRPILAATEDRGLIFVDNRASPTSAVAELAPSLGLPVVLNDRFVDAVPARSAIAGRLEELETIASRRGYAVGVAEPYPVSIEAVARWASGLDARGFVLAPASAVARIPER